jgi:hypothetical protein
MAQFLNKCVPAFQLLEYPEISTVRLSVFLNSHFKAAKWRNRVRANRWAKWIEEWRKENVRLEDLSGEPLRMPSELMDSLD